MSETISALILLAALVGHAALWVGFINRMHGTGAPHFLVSSLTNLGFLLLLFIPPAAVWYCWRFGLSTDNATDLLYGVGPAWLYLVPCWVAAAGSTVVWTYRRWFRKNPPQLMAQQSTVVDIGQQVDRSLLHGWLSQMLSHLPGNDVLRLIIEEKQVEIAHLPAALDGLTIVLLSDWHITGRIGIEYFQEVVRQANALNPDMIALCGDLIDETKHFDWIGPTIGQLRARRGVYYVLGNHDLFTHQVPRLRGVLAQAGIYELSGRWKRLEIHGAEVILAGNELPWFSPAADLSECPPRSASHSQLRILLSHSPDQFEWARRENFDLMLAGHTHGGQVRLPLVGPIFSPSLRGVKYASGTFFAEPTLMHVSRGISSELPLRVNCPPELTKLVLRCPGTVRSTH